MPEALSLSTAAASCPQDLPPARGEFVEAPGGRRFILRHTPAGPDAAPAAVLIVPPLAEEMNRCRRMLFLLGRRLAEKGLEALLPDLYGTGDSDGDFVDARWSIWIDDLLGCLRSLSHGGRRPVSVVGLRVGALLAAAVARRAAGEVESLVLWQPVVSGRTAVTQLMRTRIAAAALGRGKGPKSVAELREELRARGSLEIAGYEMHAELIADLERAELVAEPGSLPRTTWFELVREPGADVPDGALAAASKLRASGCHVEQHAVAGVQFWATTEIETVPELVERTARLLAGESS